MTCKGKKMPPIHVSIGFSVVVSIALCTDAGEMLLLTAMSVIIHEFAHVAMICFFGGCITGIWFEVCGAHIDLSSYPIMSYKKEFFISAAGPMMSFLSAYIFSIIGYFFENQSLFILSGTSFVLGLINLIPAYPLDGGRMLKCALSLFFSGETMKKISLVCCGVSAAVMLIFCFVINFSMGFNLSLTVFCAFIIIAFVKNIVIY